MTVRSLSIGFREEILFQRYVQNMLRRKYGVLWTLPLASVFFNSVCLLKVQDCGNDCTS